MTFVRSAAMLTYAEPFVQRAPLEWVRDLPICPRDSFGGMLIKQYANTTSDWEILTASIRSSFASMPQDDGIQSDSGGFFSNTEG